MVTLLIISPLVVTRWRSPRGTTCFFTNSTKITNWTNSASLTDSRTKSIPSTFPLKTSRLSNNWLRNSETLQDARSRYPFFAFDIKSNGQKSVKFNLGAESEKMIFEDQKDHPMIWMFMNSDKTVKIKKWAQCRIITNFVRRFSAKNFSNVKFGEKWRITFEDKKGHLMIWKHMNLDGSFHIITE